MTGASFVYITTKRTGAGLEILDAHRRLEYARKQLDGLDQEARKTGHRTVRTQSGCCLRTQKGDTVNYYEITKKELK